MRRAGRVGGEVLPGPRAAVGDERGGRGGGGEVEGVAEGPLKSRHSKEK